MKEIIPKEEFLHNRQTWRNYIKARIARKPHHHLLVQLLREKDVFKAFGGLTSLKKIQNLREFQGRSKYYKLEEAVRNLQKELDWLILCADVKTNPEKHSKSTQQRFVNRQSNEFPLNWVKHNHNTEDGTTHLTEEKFGHFIINEAVLARLKEKLTVLQQEISTKLKELVPA